jgi:hypothetical protein
MSRRSHFSHPVKWRGGKTRIGPPHTSTASLLFKPRLPVQNVK